jgi:hypothetical protein
MRQNATGQAGAAEADGGCVARAVVDAMILDEDGGNELPNRTRSSADA